jgi:hypothetical protein
LRSDRPPATGARRSALICFGKLIMGLSFSRVNGDGRVDDALGF